MRPLAILLAIAACGPAPSPASDVIRDATCNAIGRCIPALDTGAFGTTTPASCEAEIFVAQCTITQATPCARAIDAMPLAACGSFAKGDLPLSCAPCITNFHALPAANGGDAH